MSNRVLALVSILVFVLLVAISAWLADISYGQPGNPKHPYGSTAGDEQREVEYDNDGDHVGVNLKGLPTPIGTATPAPTARCVTKCVGGQLLVSEGGSLWQRAIPATPTGGNCACVGAGTNSTKVGVSASAAGSGAVALGNTATAAGNFSTSVGTGAGLGTTGLRTTAVGYVAGATTAGDDGVTMGYGSVNTAAQSVSIGASANTTAATSVAVGYSVDATAVSVVAVGNNALASGTLGVSVGDNSAETAASAIAIGNAMQATGVDAVGVGARGVASGISAVALGADTSADRDYCIALGFQANCSADGQLALGSGTHEITEVRPAGSSTKLGSTGHSFSELWIGTIVASTINAGITGTGKVICVKSDGNLGKCSDAPNGSGVCTCG